MLYYMEADAEGKAWHVFISRAEAVREQRVLGAQKGYAYASDAEALEDFEALHWAQYLGEGRALVALRQIG